MNDEARVKMPGPQAANAVELEREAETPAAPAQESAGVKPAKKRPTDKE